VTEFSRVVKHDTADEDQNSGCDVEPYRDDKREAEIKLKVRLTSGVNTPANPQDAGPTPGESSRIMRCISNRNGMKP